MRRTQSLDLSSAYYSKFSPACGRQFTKISPAEPATLNPLPWHRVVLSSTYTTTAQQNLTQVFNVLSWPDVLSPNPENTPAPRYRQRIPAQRDPS